MEYFHAFWTGGLICALVQILLDKTKLMPGRVMVLLVCSGALLSAVGIYQPFAEFAGAGASVPLLGFGNVLWKGTGKPLTARDFSAFYRRVQSLRCRSFCSTDFFISGQSYFQAQNERIML